MSVQGRVGLYFLVPHTDIVSKSGRPIESLSSVHSRQKTNFKRCSWQCSSLVCERAPNILPASTTGKESWVITMYFVETLSSSPMAKRNCNDFRFQAMLRCNCVNTRMHLRSTSGSGVCVELCLRNLGLQQARLLHTAFCKTRLELKVQFVVVTKNWDEFSSPEERHNDLCEQEATVSERLERNTHYIIAYPKSNQGHSTPPENKEKSLDSVSMELRQSESTVFSHLLENDYIAWYSFQRLFIEHKRTYAHTHM